tara:strand:- start:530 stop:910 length:381 start_codon:yes stop_codon:yes gene_type:complete
MSEIKTNKLTGVGTAGNVTVTDGSVTMKLQDGLAVVGVNHDLTNTTVKESFNVASITDNGTGDQTVNLSNNMNGSATSIYMGCNGYHGNGEIFGNDATSYKHRNRDSSNNLQDTTQMYSTVHGDLA